jgi:hypothetical protein
MYRWILTVLVLCLGCDSSEFFGTAEKTQTEPNPQEKRTPTYGRAEYQLLCIENFVYAHVDGFEGGFLVPVFEHSRWEGRMVPKSCF